ncbi:hypothetical protein HID58_002893 [Brassica napus]|uniref:Uncharacterized protein n=1 Tax=Brassica napus TaxID=3708 RepID=A0ABQ8ENV8_BRANA|nr:hypothetical protein HID58_002893 [Brassica napus]
MSDTCRQENGGSLLVWAKPKRIENQLFTSFSFSLAAIEYAIELSSTAYLLPGDGSPPDSITERRISSRASPLDGEVRFDHEDCISKEIKEKQPFPPHLKYNSVTFLLLSSLFCHIPSSIFFILSHSFFYMDPRNPYSQSVGYTSLLYSQHDNLQKLAILDTLLTRTQPLSEAEEAAKNKLLADFRITHGSSQLFTTFTG